MDDFSKPYPNVPTKVAKLEQPGSRESPMLRFQPVTVIFRQGQHTTLVSWVICPEMNFWVLTSAGV